MNYAHHNNKANKQIPSEQHAKSSAPAQEEANDVSGKLLVFLFVAFFYPKNKQIIIIANNKIIHGKLARSTAEILKAGKHNFMLKHKSRFVSGICASIELPEKFPIAQFVISCESLFESSRHKNSFTVSTRSQMIDNFLLRFMALLHG